MRQTNINRFLAFIIDEVIMAVLATFIVYTYTSTMSDKMTEMNQQIFKLYFQKADINLTALYADFRQSLIGGAIGVMVAVMIFMFILRIVFPCLTKGQTLGKALSRCKVESTTGEPLKIRQIVKRETLRSIFQIIAYALVVNFLLNMPLLENNLDVVQSITAFKTTLSKFEWMIVGFTIILGISVLTNETQSAGLHDRFAKTRVVIIEDKPINTETTVETF